MERECQPIRWRLGSDEDLRCLQGSMNLSSLRIARLNNQLTAHIMIGGI